MIDISNYLTTCLAIYEFYDLGRKGILHPDIYKQKISEKIEFIDNFLEQSDTKELFINNKIPPREFFYSDKTITYYKENIEKSIKFSIETLKRQTVVIYHSYFETIFCLIVEMILKSNSNLLQRISSEKDIKIKSIDAIENKDRITDYLIERLVNNFNYLSIRDKMSYFKKYFDIDFVWANENYGINIEEIDLLRQRIIHSNEEIIIPDEKILVIKIYIFGLGLYLLLKARAKYNIDVVWKDNQGGNLLK